MENKKTKCVLVMASRFDGEIQFSPNLWSSEKEAVAVFVETWIESHYLLKVITLSHEDRTDFEKEAQDSDRELKKVFNDMFFEKNDHNCVYSVSMNESHPRSCVICKKIENNRNFL